MENSLALDFYQEFKSVMGSEDYIRRVEGHYKNSDNWTRLLLKRTDANGDDNFPALRKVLENIANRISTIEKEDTIVKYGVYTEHYHIDLMLTREVWSGQYNKRDYNWVPIICLEHENNHESWFSEVVKLSNVLTDLHVVIGYSSIKNLEINARKVDRLLKNQYENNKVQTYKEFLLILGYRNIDMKRNCKNSQDIINGYKGFLWRFDTDGTLNMVHNSYALG